MGCLIFQKAAVEIAREHGLVEAANEIENLPSAPAVPLDKLCEWLASIPMMNCRVCKESIGLCTSKEAADNCCGSKERWKAILTILMEGLDAEKET